MATVSPDDDIRPNPGDEDPSEAVQELRAKLEERDREVEKLRAELARRDEQRRQAGRLAIAGGSLAARIVAGRGLTQAVRHWFKAKTLADPLPAEETANLAAAIIRRVIRVGVIGLIIAALPTILLIWQNYLIRNQNELLQRQLEQQAADTLIVRRAQLLDTIYTTECADLDKPETCKPKANRRARQEAVLAFVEIEHGRIISPDISGADLSNVVLDRADLNEANLNDANLRKAVLWRTGLVGAGLVRANLVEVNLDGADLRAARLYEADLSRASFGHADLRGANIRKTNVSGADFTSARNVTLTQLASACGDETTKLPAGFEMPDTWPCRWETDETGRAIRVPLDD